MASALLERGFVIHPSFVHPAQINDLLEELRSVARAAPMRHPVTRWGKEMSVKMTSSGRVGWISDRRGYRYEPRQPDGRDWPEIPPGLLALWHRASGLARAPDCCLINFYGEGARMGLHQDRDEGDFSWPVVSLSLGDEGLFRMGGIERSDSTTSIWLRSGDVVVMGGAARLAFHGVDRIRFGSSTLLPEGGRINVTFRVIDQGISEQQPE